MIIDIGNILIARISDLPFIDKYAGVVRPITKTDVVENRTVIKTFPVSCQTTMEQCDSGRYIDLIPESTKKSVLYLEDKGIRFTKIQGPLLHFKASFDLVCWLNMPALGFTDCSYSAVAIAGIISRIPDNFYNSGIYQMISFSIGGQQSKMTNPFQKYSYKEEVTQFLMYPYDHFVIPFEIDFAINKNCVEETEIGEADECLAPTPPRRYATIMDQDGNVVEQLSMGQTYNVIIASGIDEGDSGQTYAIQVIDIN